MIQNATLDNFNFLYELFMHHHVNPHLLYDEMSQQAFRPIFEQLIATGNMYLFCKNDQPIGMFKLIPQAYRSAHVAYLGSFAISPAHSGAGMGTNMLQEIIDYAKNIGIKRIELSVGAQNEKALSLYKKCGFLIEGTLRKYTYFKSEDKYIDEIMMSYLIE